MLFTFYASGILKRVHLWWLKKYFTKGNLIRKLEASAGFQTYSNDSRDRVQWGFPCLTFSCGWQTKSKSMFLGPNLDNVPEKNPTKVHSNLLHSSWWLKIKVTRRQTSDEIERNFYLITCNFKLKKKLKKTTKFVMQ